VHPYEKRMSLQKIEPLHTGVPACHVFRQTKRGRF
jgi:hypothetical protein